MNSQKFTEEILIRLANLAKLPISDALIPILKKSTSALLELVNKLQSIKTEDVKPTTQVTGLTNILREDVVTSSLSQEDALKNAPQKHNGYFLVPAIFDE